MKYKGYIERERIFAEKMHRLENIKIKGHFDYSNIHDLSTECRQKLRTYTTRNFGTSKQNTRS